MKILALFALAASLYAQTITGGLTPKGVVDSTGATSTAPIKSGTSLPASCAVGQMYFKTDSVNTGVIHSCTATNVWTQQGGGNVSTNFITASECNNATGNPAWDLPTSNAPAATCFGTSYRFGALAYDNAADETASFFFPLATGWTGAIDFTAYAFVNATSQSVKLTVATVCIAASEDILNPTFNAAQTITVTSPGTANQLFTFAQASMTTTGCAAGETLAVKVGRDTTDTSTATFNVTGAQLVIRITPQA